MRKPAFCIWEKQRRRSAVQADQLHYAQYDHSNIYFRNFKILARDCSCEGWCVSELVRDSKDRLSCDVALLILVLFVTARLAVCDINMSVVANM